MYIVRSGDARSGGFLQFCDSLKEITLGSGLENFFDTYDLNGSHSFECIVLAKIINIIVVLMGWLLVRIRKNY